MAFPAQNRHGGTRGQIQDEVMDTITDAQAAQLKPKLSAVLETVLYGLSKASAQRLIEMSEDDFVLVFRSALDSAGVLKLPTFQEPDSHKAARHIMGKNFLGISEVVKAFGVVSAQAQEVLAKIPFSEETLHFCRDTHVLVADIGLSIIQMRKLVRRRLPRAFQEHWYAQEQWYAYEEFAKRVEDVRWRLIRKTSVENSMSKNWSEQTALLGEDEEVPTARQVVYAIILYFATTGERLFERIYVRTSDVDSDGFRAGVGNFVESGLGINGWSDDGRDVDVLALSSARRHDI